MEKSNPISFRHLCDETKLHLLPHTIFCEDGLNRQTEVFINEEIEFAKQRLSILAKQKTGRCMQKRAAPLREGLLICNNNLQMKNIKKLCGLLKSTYGIGVVQIHMHLHPVGDTPTIAKHVHIIFNWMNEETGKSIKLGKLDLIELQKMVKNYLESIQHKLSYPIKNKISFVNLYNQMLFNQV